MVLTLYSKQAYDGLKKKYAAESGSLPTPESTKVAGSSKKRGNTDIGDDEEPTPSKKPRTTKTKVKDVQDNQDDEPSKLVDSH